MWGLAKVKMEGISDKIDTQTGMRLAGVEGVVVHEHDETVEALHRAIADGDIAIILITEKLAKLVSREMDALKLTYERPLMVEIPDRHGTGRTPDSITKYVREAIGLKI